MAKDCPASSCLEGLATAMGYLASSRVVVVGMASYRLDSNLLVGLVGTASYRPAASPLVALGMATAALVASPLEG